MRGLYTSAYLAALEEGFSKRVGASFGLDIGSVFNLIVGTSTGAIIGCGIAKGVTPKEMADLYRNNGRKIFPLVIPSSLNFRSLWSFIRRILPSPNKWNHLSQGEKGLQEALKGVFQQITLSQLYSERNIALAIPAVDMATYRPWVFKTPHLSNSNGRDNDYEIVDVCLASSAAPIYRSLAALKRPNSNEFDIFSDGGLWANNPILVALIEALRIIEDKKSTDNEIEIYCLGTFAKPEGRLIKPKKRCWGLRKWKFGGEAASLSLSSQSVAFTQMARQISSFLKVKVQIIHFPQGQSSSEMLEYLGLDETRATGMEALMRQARRDADTANSYSQDPSNIDGQLIKKLFESMSQRTKKTNGG